LHQAGSTALIESVRDGRLDFAPMGLPPRNPEGLEITVLRTEPVLLACHAQHPLAGHEHVRIEDLADEAFVDFERGWGIRLLTDDWFARSGTDRRVAFTVNDLETLLDLVGGGLGVAIVPSGVATQGPTDVHCVPFKSGAPDWKVGVVVSTERPLGFAAKKLLEMVVEAATQASGE
jgi:DNA-binding transcriptional LysR family regulator